MKLRAVALVSLLGMSAFLPGCFGRRYDNGIVSSEHAHWGLFHFARDERRVQYAILWEHLINTGSTWAGNQYWGALGGLGLFVNIPGLSWVFYPTLYHDLTDTGAHVFGIGSGDGDLRLSLLWGMLSLGRNWNVFWINGFWAGHGDPLFSEPPPEVLEEFASHVIGADPGPPPGEEPAAAGS